jgi:hypothetical protein
MFAKEQNTGINEKLTFVFPQICKIAALLERSPWFCLRFSRFSLNMSRGDFRYGHQLIKYTVP